MIDWIWTSIAGGTGVAVGIALAATVLTLRRRGEESAAPKSSSQALVAPPSGGPILRLDFSQSFDPEEFARAAEDEALSHVKLQLGNYFADGTNLTLQTLRQVLASSEMTVRVSSERAAAIAKGTAKFQEHAASGRRLSTVVDRKTGKILEQAKEIGNGRKLVGGLAAASTIVVSAAHLIATADLARTLKLVDGKLDLMLAYRRIDQTSALERIYTSAKELLSRPLGEAQRTELWRLRGELLELRAIWRRELEHNLLKIEDPAQAAWLKRMFTPQSSSDKRIAGEISEGMLQVAMVEYTLRIDRVMALASDTWDMSAVTVADELSALESVGNLLNEKSRFIAAQEKKLASEKPMVDGLGAIVKQYRALADIERPVPLGLLEAQRDPGSTV
jgi:hypothetical protein